MMRSPSTDSSLDILNRFARHGHWFFGGLLVLTIALLAWHRFGMNEVIDLDGKQVALAVEDDRLSGGASTASVERRGDDVVMRCHIVKQAQWPFCKLNFILGGAGDAGIDMSGFTEITIDASFQGPGDTRMGLILLDAEEGFTRPDQWQTYKINQVDGLELPPDGIVRVPLRWFSVAQWWKDMVKPPLEHSFTQIDNVVRVQLMTEGQPAEGDYVFVVHALQLHGKRVTLDHLLMGLVLTWIVCAIGWPAGMALILRRRLRDSTAALTLLGEVNKALELEARELVGQAHTDPLTGVLNRQGLRAALISTSNLMSDPMSVIFIDIDHFKAINDTHGHEVGDDVLRKFANLIASGIRASDQLVRWGGEEFLIVCPMTTAGQAAVLAETLRRAMHRQDWPAGLQVRASFGVAQHRHTDEISVVIRNADRELYRAKTGGRDMVQVHAADDAASPARSA